MFLMTFNLSSSCCRHISRGNYCSARWCDWLGWVDVSFLGYVVWPSKNNHALTK